MNESSTSHSLADRFADALRELEDSGATDALVDLYAQKCTTGNIVRPESHDGHEGVAEFWSTYREQFDDVHSDFAVISGDEGGAVLEWTTTGTSAGSDVTYRGATVLEIVNDEIVRSMAYYDPAALGRQVVDDPTD